MKVFATPSALPVSPPVRREPLTSPPLMSPWHSLPSAGRAAWPARFHLGSLLGMVFEIPLPCLAGSSQARDCCVPGVAGCIQMSEPLALPAPATLGPPEEALGRVAGSEARSLGLHRSGGYNSTTDSAMTVTEHVKCH